MQAKYMCMLCGKSVIYGHPVIPATRALRFADHVIVAKRNSGDENGAGWKCGYTHASITSQNAKYVFVDPSGNSEVGSDPKNSLRKIVLGKKKLIGEG